jgi:hypothetical protein
MSVTRIRMGVLGQDVLSRPVNRKAKAGPGERCNFDNSEINGVSFEGRKGIDGP